MRSAASVTAADAVSFVGRDGDAVEFFIFMILLMWVAQAFLPVPQVDWGFLCANRGNDGCAVYVPPASGRRL